MKHWLAIIIFAVFGYYLVGVNFTAKLGMIDDHEIALFLGSDGKINVTEMPGVVAGTEVGKWGSYLRYRPSYYILRVTEAALWRDNAVLWYGARYIMFVSAMVLGFLILSTYLPQIIAYLFIGYVFTMPFWPDLMTRLGPSEIYTVPAILMFVYGIVKNKLWMMTIGYAICVGAKENFLVLFPFLVLWMIMKRWLGKLTRKELVISMILIAYTLFIGLGMLLATKKAGADIYGTEISYRYRVTKLLLDIPRIINDRHVLPALVVMLLATILTIKEMVKKGWKKVFASGSTKLIGLMVMLIGAIAAQYIFYVDQLPSHMRYDFPAMLLFPVLDLAALLLVISLTRHNRYSPYVKAVVYAGILLVCTAYIWRRGYGLIQTQATRNAAVTQEFNHKIDKAAEIITNNPKAQVVFVSNRFIDFEPIVSVSRYLTARRIDNKFPLAFTPDPKLADPLGRQLQDRMKLVSDGVRDSEGLFDRFSGYIKLENNCYSITFGSALALPTCPEIARF